MARQDAYDAYRDSGGTPQFAHSCVLFWDVLGVRSMAVGADRAVHLVAIREAVQQASDRAGTEDPGMTHASTWFTDNVVIGTPLTGWQDFEQALGFTQINVSYMILLLLQAGYLSRGAITFGEHYMDERFVFGPALIEAVEIEESTKWPRVALSDEAAELNREAVRRYYGDPDASPQARELVVDDHDAVVFVDHLGVWLTEEDDLSCRRQAPAAVQGNHRGRSRTSRQPRSLREVEVAC